MSTRDADYTKTGNGLLTQIGNKMSMIPFLGGFGGILVFADGVLSAIGWLLRGKPLSALSVLGDSMVAGAVNTVASSNPVWYMANLASGLTTGRSIGTHARKLTEEATSFVTKPLGLQPTVLRSYYAGIGNGPGAMAPAAVNRNNGFVAAEAARRGQSVDQAWANINSNQTDHVAALEAARAQEAAMARG